MRFPESIRIVVTRKTGSLFSKKFGDSTIPMRNREEGMNDIRVTIVIDAFKELQKNLTFKF